MYIGSEGSPFLYMQLFLECIYSHYVHKYSEINNTVLSLSNQDLLFRLDGKVQQLLTGIQSTDECQQLQAVMELCQVL